MPVKLRSATGTGVLSTMLWCLVVGMTAITNVYSVAQTDSRLAYQVKAVFLYQFVKFVKWPASEFPDAGSPVIIGVLGDSPILKYLNATVSDQKGMERKLVVRQFQSADRAACHVLFVDSAVKDELPDILNTLRNKPILLVSDMNAFAEQGGLIQFVDVNGKIKFIINHSTAQKSGVTISAKLLALAVRVL